MDSSLLKYKSYINDKASFITRVVLLDERRFVENIYDEKAKKNIIILYERSKKPLRTLIKEYDKYVLRFRLLTLKDPFIKNVLSIRKQLNLTSISLEHELYESIVDHELSEDKGELSTERKLFHRETRKLADTYGFSEVYIPIFEEFIIYGTIPDFNRNNAFRETKTFKGEPDIIIPIYPETTIEDIRADWPLIQQRQKQMKGYREYKYKPMKNINRDIFIYRLSQTCELPAKEIEIVLNEKHNITLSYFEIHKILNEMRNKISRV